MPLAAADRPPDVLVAIDGTAPREGLRGELEDDGCDVRLAPGTGPVLPLLERDGLPDALVLEAPDGRTVERCRRVRRRYADLPLVVVSESGSVADRVAALRAGADEYVVKPFSAPEVAARVHALLRRAGLRPLGAAVLRRCGIALDGAARSVTHQGEAVTLSRIEFDLLELFLRHPGEVLGRSFIYARVWGHDAAYASNSLEVHVSGLRRKLGDPVIRTVRGVGYVLDRA